MLENKASLIGTLNQGIEYVQPITQEKTAIASTTNVIVEPDSGYTGLSKVTIEAVDNTIDENIQSYNIKAGVTILGVEGNVEPDKPDQTKTVNPSTQTQEIVADAGYELAKVTINPVTNDIDSNITSENIKEGVSILGVEGSMEEINAQSKTVTPTKQEQVITYDSEYNALDEVVVNPIPNEYIVPTGTKSITTNGTHDVSEYESANVNVQPDLSEYFETTRALASVTAGQWTRMIKTMPSLTFTGTNANYLFAEFRGTSIPSLTFTDTITTGQYMFKNCTNITSLPMIDISEITDASYMFNNCTKLTTIPQLNFGSATNVNGMFADCDKLESIPLLDFGSVTNCNSIGGSNSTFTTCGGFKDFGKAFLTTQPANYQPYRLTGNFNKLTHDSLMNIINNLYDIASKGCNVQYVTLGNTALQKLSAEEKAIATNKGWSLQ